MNALDRGMDWLRPGRLWSLWEMLEFRAAAFVAISQGLGALQTNESIRALWPEDGGKKRFSLFPGKLDDLQERLKQVAERNREAVSNLIDTSFTRLNEELNKMGLSFSQAELVRMRNSWESGRDNFPSQPEIKALSQRIIDELEAHVFLQLDQTLVEYYRQSRPIFGEEVDNAFPGATAEDISEAGKCLALGRGTACVFHLMRALEAVVQRLGSKLGATIVDKNKCDLDWGIIIANMKTPVEAMQKGDEKDRWSEAITLLIHVKQAWRHPTMHPKQTYTSEEAQEILQATKSFMRHLATLV